MLLKKPRHKEESTNEKLRRVARHITNNQPFNTSANMKQVLEDVVTSTLRRYVKTLEPGTFARVD